MRKTVIFILLVSGVFVGGGAFARLDEKVLKEKASLTVEQVFLGQVDTVALYLSTPSIIYVPRFEAGKKLLVEIVFLNRSVAGQKEGLKKLAVRHIGTFNKALKERLEFYTPGLAKRFDPKKDVAFHVLAGGKKELAATWEEGEWFWAKMIGPAPSTKVESPKMRAVAPEAVVEVSEAPEEGCKKSCPAMRGAKKEARVAPGKPKPVAEPAEQKPAEERPNRSQVQKL